MIRRYPYRPYFVAKAMTARVSFSSSSRGFGSYRCVPLHCPSSRQPYRSDNPCCSRACSTAQRRRSGLRSFPVPHPPAPASPATAPLPFPPLVTFNSLRYQQLGEPARRSRATPIPSTNRGFDTVLMHVRSRCSAVTGPVSALAEPLYLDQCGIARSQAARADRPRRTARRR